MKIRSVVIDINRGNDLCYTQVCFNPDTLDFETYTHTGFYVNFQTVPSEGYVTIGNYFPSKGLTKTIKDDINYYFGRNIF